jgi:hypothetical protein
VVDDQALRGGAGTSEGVIFEGAGWRSENPGARRDFLLQAFATSIRISFDVTFCFFLASHRCVENPWSAIGFVPKPRHR